MQSGGLVTALEREMGGSSLKWRGVKRMMGLLRKDDGSWKQVHVDVSDVFCKEAGESV